MNLETTKYRVGSFASGIIEGGGFALFILACVLVFVQYQNGAPYEFTVPAFIALFGFLFIGFSYFLDATIETALNTRVLAKNVLDNINKD